MKKMDMGRQRRGQFRLERCLVVMSCLDVAVVVIASVVVTVVVIIVAATPAKRLV